MSELWKPPERPELVTVRAAIGRLGEVMLYQRSYEALVDPGHYELPIVAICDPRTIELGNMAFRRYMTQQIQHETGLKLDIGENVVTVRDDEGVVPDTVIVQGNIEKGVFGHDFSQYPRVMPAHPKFAAQQYPLTQVTKNALTEIVRLESAKVSA